MINDDFMTSPDRGCAPGKANPDIFFACARQADNSTVRRAAKKARDTAIEKCRHCPFTKQCFTWAEENDHRHGIWGAVDMGSYRDRVKARAFYGMPPLTTEPDEVVEELAEPDDVLIELEANGEASEISHCSGLVIPG